VTARWERALVTGASSGIGEAFARQLVAEGTKVIAVARREDRLRALPGDVEVLVADLSTEGGIASVEARLERGDVDLLINNAGFGTTCSLVEARAERVTDEITVDVVALARLTRAALPTMVASGTGAVLNVGSVLSFYPLPHMATYAASKAFVKSFSEAVAEEVRGSGVHVTVLCPGLTRSEFHRAAGADDMRNLPGVMWKSAEAVARIGLDGVASGRVVVVPGVLNRAVTALASVVPNRVIRRAASFGQRLRGV
jgi:short-subunit dehydrogenase